MIDSDRAAPLPVRIIRADHLPSEALADLLEGLKMHEVWRTFALHEIRQRFRRSVLGPFWLTLSMGIMVAALGLVFSTLFGQNVSETLPFIAIGLIFWGLLTANITEGSTVFIGSESYIRNVPLPVSVHFYRMMARNLIIWAFNMAIYLVVLVWFRIVPDWHFLLFIPGFALFIVNTAWMGLAAGILSTRFRDIPQVITNVVQVIFFLTPVFWSPAVLEHRPAFVEWNPLYHLLELVRAPLIGHDIAAHSWLFALGLAVAGVAFTLYLYRRAYARIAYWV
jgi:ABC-2 type transport system permease protein/lipopolysaccharide transport system permease protein